MNSLLVKIQQAANLFQTHDFKKSLQLYQQCISICKKNQEPKSLLFNLMSSKGALLSILGDQNAALDCLNQVLIQDSYHLLCLIRRSQVFKKKNKLNKALKDLKFVGSFSPDNLQIAAMKVQIQNLKLKSKQVDSSSESDQETQKSNQSLDLDEQQKLNFASLKQIDRKSVSIMINSNVSRKSRVTIAGDIAIQYELPEDNEQKDDKSFASTNVSKEYVKEKYIKTFRQIELDDDEEQEQGKSESFNQLKEPIIQFKASDTGRTKSILKNRNSTIYLNNNPKFVEKEQKYGGRHSKMIDMLKDIDGKVIPSTFSERSSDSIKEVEFRKSMFGMVDQIKVLELGTVQSQGVSIKPKASRKSCLKRSSFESLLQAQSKSQPRISKLDRISKLGIDGAILKSQRKSIQKTQAMSNNNNNDSDSDEGSQHNIFGSNQIVIGRQMRQNLGLGEDSKEVKKTPKPRTEGGKSILKKNSLLLKIHEKSKQSSPLKQEKKAKKSVMFTKFE